MRSAGDHLCGPGAERGLPLESVAPEVPKVVPIKVPMAVPIGVPSGAYWQICRVTYRHFDGSPSGHPDQLWITCDVPRHFRSKAGQ